MNRNSVLNLRRSFDILTACNGLQGRVDCFPRAKLCGLAAGEEIGDPKDAVNHPDVMEKAYKLGKTL